MKNRGPLVMVSFLAAGLLLASVLLAFGHSGGTAAQPSLTNTNTISTPAERAQTISVHISITDFGFDPDELTIFDGTTVVWTNNRDEEVHLVSGMPGQVFLPLVVSDNDGRVANSDSIPEKAVSGWDDLILAPGQSYSYTFPTAEVFRFHIEGEPWLGQITVHFRNDGDPAVSWATSPSAVLLRWRWPGRCDDPATFNLYRNGSALAAGITRITDPYQVTTTLGSDWNWITSQYTDVITVGEFLNKLDDNPMLADQLANTHYRVALVLGWGYLDETANPGSPYVYEVRQLVNAQEQLLGAAEILAGQITPLAAPTNLTAVQTFSPTLRTSPDWIEAQQNRKADRKIYLRWDVLTSTATEWPSNQWAASYDVFRATNPNGPYARINIQDGEDRPVIPAPAYSPTSPQGVQDPLYQEYDHFFVDDDPTLQYTMTYYYRVAARDLLDQPRQWPAHQSQFSNIVSAIPEDTLPPPVPESLTSTSLTTTVVLTWTPQMTDTTGYWLYKTTNITASVLTETCTNNMMDKCWTKIVEVGSPTTGVYTDTNVDIDTLYWYRIRAVDDANNLSAWSDPVRGIVHDSTGPCAPIVWEREGIIYADPCPQAPDTALFSLLCRFDNGPELLLKQITTETLPAAINLQDYYTPAAPVDVICRLQAIDTHGNLGDSSTTSMKTLCPSLPVTPTKPIIQDIETIQIAENSFAAEIHWEAEESPDLVGFEIYRQIYGPNTPELVAAEGPDIRSFLDTGVKTHYNYSYTVTAVRGADACGKPQLKVSSKPKFYKVIPPLDCCTRPTIEVLWDEPSSNFAPGVGTTLVWQNPRPEAEAMYVIVYRSMRPDRDFVAITPPMYTVTPVYIDTDAEHGDYWYMVLMLNWWTGEVIGASEAWSDGGGSPRAIDLMPDIGLMPGLPYQKELREAVWAPRAPSEAAYEQLDSIADTYVDQMNPDENHGASDQMLVENSSEVIFSARRALAQFDFSSIPNGSTIDHATFSAYVTGADGNPVDIDLRRIDSYWEELSVTWNIQPISGTAQDTITVGELNGWYTWTVTNLMHEWWELASPNYGLMLVGPTDDHFRSFSTKESSDPPRLNVHYFTPPDILRFGIFGDNPYEFLVQEYYPGSQQHNLNGIGTLVLGGGAVEPVTYTIEFANIAIDPSGIVLTGAITVPLTIPIEIAYPGGFEYSIQSLTVNQDTGQGQVDLTLPDHMVAHFWGIPWNAPVMLNPTAIHQDLTFGVPVGWWGTQDCTVPPDFSFEMNPLPWHIVPTGPVTFTHNLIELGNTCTQYDERFAGSPPVYPDPDTNYGYFRPDYHSVRPAFILPDGLHGGFSTAEPVSYTTAVPYGFEIKATGGVTMEIVGGRINDGLLLGIELGIWYYDSLVTQTIPFNAATVPPPTRYFSGTTGALIIGQNGYLMGYIEANRINLQLDPLPITWAGGGFVLREEEYQLYIPPIVSMELPWQDVAAGWEINPQVQSGLNHTTPPGESADFTWYHCSTDKEIRFPDGVSTDLYLRRGGVSDYVSATIPVTNPVHTTLHGYTTTLKTFRVSFCDNSIHDRDVAGDFDLPWPADVVIPTYDMNINPNTACVESAKVREDADPLLLAYWQVNLHPKAIAFRPEPGLTPPPADWDALLWLLGSADVPHLAPPRSTDVAAIPLETSFEPNGNFRRSRLIYNQAHYAFDSFDLLLSKVRLSDWESSFPEHPSWRQEASLENPPQCCDPLPTDPYPHGFVELQGNLIVPYFSTLAGDTANSRPAIQVVAWDDYVGFTERPHASRSWKLIGGKLAFDFDLTYAHHHTDHTGVFVGFDQHDMEVFRMDSAAVISPTSGGIYLGMSSGTAALRALAETTISSLPSTLGTTLSNTMTNQWLTRFYGMDESYVTLLGLIWNNSYSFRETTTKIENKITELGDNMPASPVGGETTSWLASPTGVIVNQLRGDVEFKPIMNGNAIVDHQFERLRVALKLEVDPADVKEILKAKRLALEINRQGDFLLSGKRVKVDLYKYKVDADLALNINIKKKRMEGGLKLYDLEISGIKFKYIGGVLGVGADLYYTGGMGEAKFQWGKVGGGFLFGRLDPSSQVLKQMGFGNLLKTLSSSGKSGTWAGAYTRVYGDFPLYNYGCMFKVNVGGDIALWYFAPISSQTEAYGGRMRGYVYGKLLCVVSGRGDLTMELSVPGYGGQGHQWVGNFWAAGGIGFCDPEDWTTWDARWWGDSWCWTCGAYIKADYNKNKPDAWNWNYDSDCE